MRNTKNTIITLLFIFLITLSLFIAYVAKVMQQQQRYESLLKIKIDQYLQQQFYAIKRLGASLIPAIKMHDTNTIATNIVAYEEILYGLSKQKLAVASNLYLVSLNAPQTIIGSNGLLDSTVLAPDHAYYFAAVEDSQHLTISKPYVKSEMPDYPMMNFGLGIFDQQNNYYGQLDMKLAVAGLEDYLQAQIVASFKNNSLFNFKIADVHSPKIILNQTQCWLQCFYYISLRLLLIVAAALLILAFIKARKYSRNNNLKIKHLTMQLQNTELKLKTLSEASAVQNKYGTMQLLHKTHLQNIYVKQLLQDVLAVNLPNAVERGITINIPALQQENLAFYGDKIKMMQILSSILHEIILQLNPQSTIILQVSVAFSQVKSQSINFTFTDNGFYEKLLAREACASIADVRCHGWHNILDLIAKEDGTFAHVHTAYSGNEIIFTIPCELVNNVVDLGAYLSN